MVRSEKRLNITLTKTLPFLSMFDITVDTLNFLAFYDIVLESECNCVCHSWNKPLYYLSLLYHVVTLTSSPIMLVHPRTNTSNLMARERMAMIGQGFLRETDILIG